MPTTALLDSSYTLCSCGLEIVQVLKEQTQVWGQDWLGLVLTKPIYILQGNDAFSRGVHLREGM